MAESALNSGDPEIDNELRSALASRIKEKTNQLTDFERRGLQITGIELRGRAMQLQEFKNQESAVSFIERKIVGRPDPSPDVK